MKFTELIEADRREREQEDDPVEFEWESMALCAKELNVDLASIWKILSGWRSKAPDGSLRPYKSHEGYTFQYKDHGLR